MSILLVLNEVRLYLNGAIGVERWIDDAQASRYLSKPVLKQAGALTLKLPAEVIFDWRTDRREWQDKFSFSL